MIKISEGIYTGNQSDCFHPEENSDWFVVHACKFPCHRDAVGYNKSPDKQSPFYLYKEAEGNLYLNMIDPPVPLFDKEMFRIAILEMSGNWAKGKNILIHCNQGESRSPTLAMLLLRKIEEIPYDEYFNVVEYFKENFFPAYAPGKGLETYLKENLKVLIKEAMSYAEDENSDSI